MGAQLNIKDPETVSLARKLADEAGQSVTETIRKALERERLARDADLTERRRQVEDILDEVRRNLPPEVRGMTSKEIMDSIYDEHGLPA